LCPVTAKDARPPAQVRPGGTDVMNERAAVSAQLEMAHLKQLVLVAATLFLLGGCYSTAAFHGEGQIQESPEPDQHPLLLYRITFPEVDLSRTGVHEFRFRGAPARGPMAVLLASPSLGRTGLAPRAIVTRLEDEQGALIEERGVRDGWSLANGRPGPVWSEFISSTTDYDVPTARMENLRSGRWYTLKVSVLKDSHDGPTMARPAIDFLRDPFWVFAPFR
jgi:hypothetical protein